MSFERYIKLLQELITMTDPNNAAEMLNAKSVLKNLYELAESSGMADAETMRGMSAGLHEFSAILRRKNDFAGIPGQPVRNEAKRSRLALLICPEVAAGV